MTRRAWALATLAVWLVALGWLVHREYLGQSDGLSVLTAPLPPGATFFSVSLGDRQIGTASVTGDTLEAGGVRLVSRLDLDLPLGGTVEQAISATDAVYSNDLRLRRFDTRTAGLLDGHDRSGLVSGDSVVALTLGTAEEPIAVVRQPVTGAGPLGLPAAAPLRLALTGGLLPGRTVEARVIDPANMAIRTEIMTVLGDSTFVVPDSADLDSASGTWLPASYDTLTAWRLSSTRYGLPVTTWVDELGYVVSSSTPLGFSYQRGAFELVSENFRRGAAGRSAPAAGYPRLGLSERPQLPELSRARYLLGGVSVEDGAWDSVMIDHPWQRRIGDTVVSSTEPLDTLQLITMNYRIPWEENEPWNELATGFDLDDPRIRSQARRIRRYQRFVMPVVSSLVKWIADSIDLAPPGTPATAGQVLNQRRGDVSGQVALFLAMAHNLGIPARPVAGLIQVEGEFYYHSWAEVWYTEWVPVDPSLGRDFAGPWYIRLLVGSLAQPVEIQAMIGRVRPKVLSLEEAR